MQAWVGPQVEGGKYLVYVITGELASGTLAELTAKIATDAQAERAGPACKRIPRSVEHSVIQVLQSAGPGKVVSGLEWAQAVSLESEQIYARFFCGNCKKERRIKAAFGNKLDQRLAAGPVMCHDIGANCNQPFLPEQHLTATIADPPARDEPPEWVKGLMQQQQQHMQQQQQQLQQQQQQQQQQLQQQQQQAAIIPASLEKLLKAQQDLTAQMDRTMATMNEGRSLFGRSTTADSLVRTLEKNANLPKYSGDRSHGAVQAWAKRCEALFRQHEVVDEKKQIELAAKMLTDRAAQWWSGMELTGGAMQLQTFTEMISHMSRHFVPLEDWVRMAAKWKRLRQGDSFSSYKQYIMNLHAVFPLGDRAEMLMTVAGMRDAVIKEVVVKMEEAKVDSPSLAQVLRWGELASVNVALAAPPRGNTATIKQGKDNSPKTASLTVQQLTETLLHLCLICESKEHSTFKCKDKKQSGCFRCGSSRHRLKDCPNMQLLKKKLANNDPACHGIVTMAMEMQQQEDSAGSEEGDDNDDSEEVGSDMIENETSFEVSAAQTAFPVWSLAAEEHTAMPIGAQLLFYKVWLIGGWVTALLDPGSQMSLINEGVARRKGLQRDEMPTKGGRVVMAGGQGVPITHWIPQLKMQKGNWIDVHPVLVVPHLTFQLLLGMD